MGFFSSRSRKADQYQGFAKYNELIHRYDQNYAHDDHVMNAGSAASAAVKMHQKGENRTNSMRTSSMTNRTSSMTSRAGSMTNRANSMTTPSNRANSMTSRTTNANRNTTNRTNSLSGIGRANSITSRTSTRTNSMANRANSLTSRTRNNGPMRQVVYNPVPSYHTGPRSPKTVASPKTAPKPVFEEFDENDEVEEVVVTKTTRVVDAQGRTSSITTKTVTTLPDGSNIIETTTKNISRGNSRTNSMTSVSSNRAHMVNLDKIDEDLHDFDYHYELDGLRLNNQSAPVYNPSAAAAAAAYHPAAASAAQPSPKQAAAAAFNSPKQVVKPHLEELDDELERERKERERKERERKESERKERERKESERKESERKERERKERERIEKERKERERKERERVEKERSEKERSEKERIERVEERKERETVETERIDAKKSSDSVKPLRSILKEPEHFSDASDGLSREKKELEERNENNEVGEKSEQKKPTSITIETSEHDSSHPYKSITSPFKPSQPPRISVEKSPGSPGHVSERPEAYVHSPESSIKFDEHVETIPAPNYSMEVSADMYAAAMQAAYKKVYGERTEEARVSLDSPKSRKLGSPKSPKKGSDHDDRGLEPGFKYQNHHRDFATHSLRVDMKEVAKEKKVLERKMKEEEKLLERKMKEEEKKMKEEEKRMREEEKRERKKKKKSVDDRAGDVSGEQDEKQDLGLFNRLSKELSREKKIKKKSFSLFRKKKEREGNEIVVQRSLGPTLPESSESKESPRNESSKESPRNESSKESPRNEGLKESPRNEGLKESPKESPLNEEIPSFPSRDWKSLQPSQNLQSVEKQPSEDRPSGVSLQPSPIIESNLASPSESGSSESPLRASIMDEFVLEIPDESEVPEKDLGSPLPVFQEDISSTYSDRAESQRNPDSYPIENVYNASENLESSQQEVSTPTLSTGRSGHATDSTDHTDHNALRDGAEAKKTLSRNSNKKGRFRHKVMRLFVTNYE